MSFKNSLDISHKMIRETVKIGDTVIDATMGKGKDTLFLADIVGENGKVYAFDIQKMALIQTAEKLKIAGFDRRVELIQEGHQNMKDHVKTEVSAIMYNLGYLPGGDHNVFTMAETTKQAIEASLNLIKVGGIISIVVYYGGDSGYEEKNDLMEYIKTIDNKRFSVLKCSWENQLNDPPIAVIIEKLK